MIAKEGLPSLQWPTPPRYHVDGNRGLGDRDAEFEQFAVNLGSAPQRVLKTHSSDQVAHLSGDPRSAPRRAEFPSPVPGPTLAMPAHDSLGPDDADGIKNARVATIEPDEQGAVDPMQMQSTARSEPNCPLLHWPQSSTTILDIMSVSESSTALMVPYGTTKAPLLIHSVLSIGAGSSRREASTTMSAPCTQDRQSDVAFTGLPRSSESRAANALRLFGRRE